ncbi:MAG TPA: DUF4932 domain-containing protein [Kofleriaceae bacterium]
MRALLVLVLMSGTAAAAAGVHVDRRVELVSAAERLAGAREYGESEHTPYVDDLDKLLAPFAHHPAIEMARKLHDAGIAYDAPMSFAIMFDDPQRAAHLRAMDPRWNHGDPDAWANALMQLERDAKLDAFWDAHAGYIKQVEQRYADAIARDKPEAWYAELFGPSKQAFRIVPSLINGPSNYGPHTDVERIQIMGLGNVDAKGLPILDDAAVAVIVHEMGHSFVNPVIDRHRAELDAAAGPLYAAVAKQMQEHAYGAVDIMLYESCVRALTTLYAREHHGADAGADAARAEIGTGFAWTPALADLFATFHAKHIRNLDAFVPQLVAFFAATSKQYEHGAPPHAFVGPIDGIGTDDNAFVHSPDAGVASYATKVRDKFLPKATLRAVAATDHFDTAPAGQLRLYGSPSTNPLVADLAKRAGWKIGEGTLAIGRERFTGPGLVLIACWPRPGDTSHGVVVYTSAHDTDVVGINSLMAGGTDWVIGRKVGNDFKLLANGNFHVTASGAWKLP